MQPLRQIQTIWSKMLDEMGQNQPQPFANLDLNKLNHIFSIGDSYYFVLNITSATIEFTSPEVTKMMGYSPATFSVPLVVSSIHPDDVAFVVEFEQAASQFFQSIPKEKVPQYKSRYDYRIKKADGNYLRVLQQSVTIEMGTAGEILRTFTVHTDITHIKTEGNPMLSFIGLNDEPSYINVKGNRKFSKAEDVLSKREREILLHIVNGKSSAEIAGILFLSKHTVDTHRRNMKRKTGVKRNIELISAAIKNGLI